MNIYFWKQMISLSAWQLQLPTYRWKFSEFGTYIQLALIQPKVFKKVTKDLVRLLITYIDLDWASSFWVYVISKNILFLHFAQEPKYIIISLLRY